MKLLGAYLARHGKLLLLLTGSMFICAWKGAGYLIEG